MKKSFALTFGLTALLFAGPGRSAPSKLLAITHVTVIDATGAAAKPDMTVLITMDRITQVGPSNKIHLPKDAEVVDGTGKFLIPGLWDMHVHLFGCDEASLKLFIANGVTGVRIMWGVPKHLQCRKNVEEGSLLGPRMVIASTIVDGPKPIWPGSISVSNEVEGRQAVTKVKQDGADFVKVYTLLPRAAYFAIADEAKKQGITFVGHVPDAVSVAEASDAGQKSIEHLTGVLVACSSREEELRQGRLEAFAKVAPDQTFPNPATLRPLTRSMLDTFSRKKATALFALLKRNHTWQCPTMTVLRSTAFINDPVLQNDPRLKYLPRRMTAIWDPRADFRFKDKTQEDFDLARLIFERQKELVGMMHQSGVEFLAGTDTPNPFCFPGFSLHDELNLLVQAGLSPMEALQTATINPARFFGTEKTLGTIEAGKLADLVLLDANPLQAITNTQKINAVVINGRLLDRRALDKLLQEAQANASQN